MSKFNFGDKWEEHYRGFELRINGDGDIWWQVYNGTDRLHLEPKPEDLVEQFLELKPLGGRIRVTEGGTVITRQEDEDAEGGRGAQSLDDYTPIYVCELELDGELVPKTDPEFSISIRPTGLSSGDLWPSVYDGARYSFSMSGDAWWQNTRTKKRHPVHGGLPNTVESTLTQLKPEGGSFRVTPWGDVITLVRAPAKQLVRDQFSDLPRVVQNIIKLRREQAGLEMLPVYVSSLPEVPLEVEDPPSLTDELSEAEQESLEGWAASLGSTTNTTAEAHQKTAKQDSKVSDDATGVDEDETKTNDAAESDSSGDSDDNSLPDDDPLEWIKRDINKMGESSDDR